MDKLTLQNSAFVLVDYQNDFVDEKGSLCVKSADSMEATINSLVELFLKKGVKCIATQDFHPSNHTSFAASHSIPDFTEQDGEMKWPIHCVANQWGSQLYQRLDDKNYSKVVYKGTKANEDAYSGFKGTDLDDYLTESAVRNLFIGGVATDFCVNHTALDGNALGYNVYILSDIIKGVFPENEEKIFDNWSTKGIVQLST
ncbi:MAG: isochorismatase family protein, partial [Candidatus Absconditabacteria bacterium]